MLKVLLLLALIGVAFVSGCTTQNTQNDLGNQIDQADPDQVLDNELDQLVDNDSAGDLEGDLLGMF